MKRYIIILFMFIGFSGYSQNKGKGELYLLFEPDSNNLRFEREQKPTHSNGEYLPDRYDVYGFKTIARDKNIVIVSLPFATINKYRYRVTDSIGLKEKTIIPLKNVLQLRDVHYDILEKNTFHIRKSLLLRSFQQTSLKLSRFILISVRMWLAAAP